MSVSDWESYLFRNHVWYTYGSFAYLRWNMTILKEENIGIIFPIYMEAPSGIRIPHLAWIDLLNWFKAWGSFSEEMRCLHIKPDTQKKKPIIWIPQTKIIASLRLEWICRSSFCMLADFFLEEHKRRVCLLLDFASLTRWWFQPLWKISSSNWIISPGNGEKKHETTT